MPSLPTQGLPRKTPLPTPATDATPTPIAAQRGCGAGWRASDVPPSRRELDVLGTCLSSDSVKQAAHAHGVSYDRMRHILHDLYRDLGVSTMAQAVARLDDTVPGWRDTTSMPGDTECVSR